MTTLLHAVTAVDAITAWLTAAWMGFSELITASLLLMLLNTLSNACRAVYSAGKATGHLWFVYGLPALLWTADQLSALITWVINRDWEAIGQEIKEFAALCITCVLIVRDSFNAWHQAWIGTIDWTPATASPVYGPWETVYGPIDIIDVKWDDLRKASKATEATSNVVSVATLAPPFINPLYNAADELLQYTARELKELTGIKSKRSKLAVIEAYITR